MKKISLSVATLIVISLFFSWGDTKASTTYEGDSSLTEEECNPF